MSLIKRLREAQRDWEPYGVGIMAGEAASELEAKDKRIAELEAENARLIRIFSRPEPEDYDD